MAREVWPWLRFTELMDSKGPMQAAAALGMTREALEQTLSPIEAVVLRMFQQHVVDPQGTLWELMLEIGTQRLEYLRQISRL